MSMRESLAEAMRLPADSDALGWMHSRGMAVADEDTMSRAIHDVYCGIMADHDHANDKDREQARAMMAALQRLGTDAAT
jgi:hypothetical protein